MTLTLSGRPWYLENVNRHCLAALVKADWGRDSESFHLLPLQFCKKAFPSCQTLIIYALLGNERRGQTQGKHQEPVLSCRAFGTGSLRTREQMWGDHLCPRTIGQAPCLLPKPPLRWVVDAAGRGGVKGQPPHTHMNIYKGSGFLLHPPASRKPSQPASLGESPQALKASPIGPLSSQPIECQTKPFFSCLKTFFSWSRGLQGLQHF